MKSAYLLAFLTAALVVLFYLCLPELKTCPLPAPRRKESEPLAARLFLPALTLLYAVTAFVHLGQTSAPQSFATVPEEGLVFTLASPTRLDRIWLYTGIVPGSYELEYSLDGETWQSACSYDQNYAALLKWEAVDLGAVDAFVQALRISSPDAAELGELGALDWAGSPVALFSDETRLCDEQALVPVESSYLNSSYFDEIYHVRTAEEMRRGVWPYEISHPPLGKLLIGLGVSLFGLTPFGWRFMGTLCGVAMLPLLYAFARRLFGGRAAPGCCAVLMASEFMHFVQTRLATIDSFSLLFILLMSLCFWLWLDTGKDRYLALSGLSFGLGAATKWICLYAGAGLGLLWLSEWLCRFLDAGREQRRETARAFARNVLFCLLFFVLLPGLIYCASYARYGVAEGTRFFSADYFRLVWENQVYMLSYHANITATHPYSSVWYQWLLDIRPILYYLKYFPDGTRSSFGAWLNPVVCWGGLCALPVLGYMGFGRGDRRAQFLLVCYLAQLLPWVFISRVVFAYHYFACSLFLILALGYVFSLMREAGGQWRIPVYGLTALSVLLFALFYPALSGLPVDNSRASALLRWLPTWPF